MFSSCPDCNKEFYYDEFLNVKHFEAEANHIGFRMGGDFPICPKCEKQCQTEQAIQWEKSQVKIIKGYVLIPAKRLNK